MKKIIVALSLFFSLIGLIGSFYFLLFKVEDLTKITSFIFFDIQPYYFLKFYISIVTERIDEHTYSSTQIGLLNIFFYLSFLAGAIIYLVSHYKESRLLNFNFSLMFFYSIFKLIYFVVYFNDDKYSFQFSQIIYLLITILYLFMCYQFITKHLNILEFSSIATEENENRLIKASNYKRFLNLAIDTFIIFLIAYNLMEYAERDNAITVFFAGLKSFFGDQLSTFVFFGMLKFIYYLSFEILFKSTPAKLLTGCYVTDEDGDDASFSMILRRTFYRFIPFESFTFLFGRNLHDDSSYTTVVNKKRSSNTDNLYFLILTISFLTMLIIYFYNGSNDRHFY